MHLTLKKIEESGLYEIVQDSHRTIYYLSDLREFLDKEDSLQYSLTTVKNRHLPMLISENEMIVNGTTVAFVYTNPSGLIIFCTKQMVAILYQKTMVFLLSMIITGNCLLKIKELNI